MLIFDQEVYFRVRKILWLGTFLGSCLFPTVRPVPIALGTFFGTFSSLEHYFAFSALLSTKLTFQQNLSTKLTFEQNLSTFKIDF